MSLCILAVYMLVTSFILALLEIQIEGKNGWAKDLPTWRISNKLTSLFYGARPLTGYHLHMNIFVLLLLHLPVFFTGWSWELECILFGFLIGMWTIEDFLWFVFNPHYGLKKFKKENIPWHKNWWGPVPDFYIPFAIFSGTLLYLGRQFLLG